MKIMAIETARKKARSLLGRIAQGDNPAEERRLKISPD